MNIKYLGWYLVQSKVYSEWYLIITVIYLLIPLLLDI